MGFSVYHSAFRGYALLAGTCDRAGDERAGVVRLHCGASLSNAGSRPDRRVVDRREARHHGPCPARPPPLERETVVHVATQLPIAVAPPTPPRLIWAVLGRRAGGTLWIGRLQRGGAAWQAVAGHPRGGASCLGPARRVGWMTRRTRTSGAVPGSSKIPIPTPPFRDIRRPVPLRGDPWPDRRYVRGRPGRTGSGRRGGSRVWIAGDEILDKLARAT